MITITRKLDIEAGHRLRKHESKCKNAHGHHYHFEVTCSGTSLDEVGRVIDFTVVKQLVGGWLDEHWDHGMLLERGDPLTAVLQEMGDKVYVLDCPPSAENIAQILLRESRKLLRPHGVSVERVRCWETPNCYADAEGL